MKKIIFLFTTLLLTSWSNSSLAFTCIDASGQKLVMGYENFQGSMNVFLNLKPLLSEGENLVVNLADSLMCKNDDPDKRNEAITILKGFLTGNSLDSLTGTIKFYGTNYDMPLPYNTTWKYITSGSYAGVDIQVYINPVSVASGVVLKAGSLFAQLVLRESSSEKADQSNAYLSNMVWYLYTNNDVVIPTGGCDVSARNVTVDLPDYPGETSIPVTVHCTHNQILGFYLSGATEDSGNSIFTNSSSISPAQGVGVQIKKNGKILKTNSAFSLGTVGTTPVDLGLTASYARTTGQVTAGNVQSIVDVTFIYF